MDELGKKGSMPIPASSSNGMLRGYLSRPPKKIYSSQFFFFKISLCVCIKGSMSALCNDGELLFLDQRYRTRQRDGLKDGGGDAERRCS